MTLPIRNGLGTFMWKGALGFSLCSLNTTSWAAGPWNSLRYNTSFSNLIPFSNQC